MWSAQEDSQLIGRVWRYPQAKQVHVYRLIAWNTPDVFLNRISFDKATMMKAFTGMTGPMRTFLTTMSCRLFNINKTHIIGNLFGQESEKIDVIDDGDDDDDETQTNKAKVTAGKSAVEEEDPTAQKETEGGKTGKSKEKEKEKKAKKAQAKQQTKAKGKGTGKGTGKGKDKGEGKAQSPNGKATEQGKVTKKSMDDEEPAAPSTPAVEANNTVAITKAAGVNSETVTTKPPSDPKVNAGEGNDIPTPEANLPPLPAPGNVTNPTDDPAPLDDDMDLDPLTPDLPSHEPVSIEDIQGMFLLNVTL